MGGKQKNNNEIISVASDKEVYDIPKVSISFLTEENEDYITVLKAQMRAVNGHPQEWYKAQINAPKLVRHLLDNDLMNSKVILHRISQKKLDK